MSIDGGVNVPPSAPEPQERCSLNNSLDYNLNESFSFLFIIKSVLGISQNKVLRGRSIIMLTDMVREREARQ